ncbi:MAG: pentapeptide repeat-containing protein [Microcoleaceae cyanobacterium MO_207.B10]|nr:pentapeptide repeat-containing protein [Microcoleaceae cyanobacterium MO_207.B10]
MEREELLKKYAEGERNFTGIILCEANLSKVNLSQINFSQAVLNLTNFSGANLSETNLSGAKLNVARLTGINLTGAKLNGATLNVTNLIQANLNNAELIEAKLIRAELIRANLSNANLKGANLTEADLREVNLRQANLQLVDLNSARLRGSSLVNANLKRANLNRVDLSKADLKGVNFSNSELKQAKLAFSDLSKANLTGANLRWADLTGANLSGANLDSATLSGANLYGANLENANLSNAVLVHADLTKTNLIHVSWEGADLTAATLTASKLYGVSRFTITAQNITCDWVDMSVNGDGSEIINLTQENSQKFFNTTQPIVKVIVNMSLNPDTHLALAAIYRQLYQLNYQFILPPNIEVNSKKTILSFRVEKDQDLLTTAYAMIYPFKESTLIQNHFLELIEKINQDYSRTLDVRTLNIFAKIRISITKIKRIISDFRTIDSQKKLLNLKFFTSPIQIITINSLGQEVKIKNIIKSQNHHSNLVIETEAKNNSLFSDLGEHNQHQNILINFVKNFTE